MVISFNPSSLMVSWQPPPYYEEIVDYVIEYTRVGGSSDTVTVTNRTTHIISGLVPVVPYSVRVAAMNENGIGPYSDAMIRTSGEDGKSMSIISAYDLACLSTWYSTKITNGGWFN